MANAGDEQPEAAEDPETAASFKRFKRRGNARKREKAPPAESTADSDDKSAVVRKEAREKAGIQRLHKRPKASLEDDVFGTQYSASKSLMSEGARDDATRTIEIDDPTNLNNTNFRGPMRAPTAVRTTLRIDYQPDLCKDYKDTGYCGYGDSCKFMHDRGDYLSGWQMEKQWDAQQAARKKKFMEGGEEEAEDEVKRDEDDLPWGCFICRGPFTSAIMTKCKHYFCESCALKRYSVEKVRSPAPSPPSLPSLISTLCRNPTWGAWFNWAFPRGAGDWLLYLHAADARHLQRGRVAAGTRGGGAGGSSADRPEDGPGV
jgi:RING finger protein 113A